MKAEDGGIIEQRRPHGSQLTITRTNAFSRMQPATRFMSIGQVVLIRSTVRPSREEKLKQDQIR